MKYAFLFLCLLASMGSFSQFQKDSSGLTLRSELSILPTPMHVIGAERLHDDIQLKNDTQQVVLKIIILFGDYLHFELCKAIAIYKTTKVFYWDYPGSGGDGRSLLNIVDAVYRAPTEESRVESQLLKILVEGREFDLSKYHEIIPLNQISNQ